MAISHGRNMLCLMESRLNQVLDFQKIDYAFKTISDVTRLSDTVS